ncbi:MAG: glycosyltransferase family 2 protein [Phycisphaerales bacterium]
MTRRKTLVDVIIPAYRAEQTIVQTLESLIAQTDGRWRAWIMEDGLTDNTGNLANGMKDPRIICHALEKRGVSAARNAGFAFSDAPFVCFLDADDTIAPSYMERMISAARSSQCGASCGYSFINSAGDILQQIPAAPTNALSTEALLRLDPPAIMSLLHRRDVLEKVAVNGELFDTRLSMFEDWDLLKRIAQITSERWVQVPHVLANYHCTPGSASTKSIHRLLECGLKAIQSMPASPTIQRASIRSHRVNCLAAAVVSGEPEIAREIAADLIPLLSSDIGTLSTSISWHAMRRWGVTRVQLEVRCQELVANVQESFGETAQGRLLTRCIDQIRDNPWHLAFEEAKRSLRNGGRIVLFGLGRNGLEAVQAAQELGIDCVTSDDDSHRFTPNMRSVRPDEITKLDTVILTPLESDPIAQRLNANGIENLVRPQSLPVRHQIHSTAGEP